MIKLTINSDSGSTSYSFDKKVLIIGNDSSNEIDIPLKEPGIMPIHLKISEEDGFYIVTNYANDPFVTLNNTPFGKKILKNSDYLTVGKSVITFEISPYSEGNLFIDLNKTFTSQIATQILKFSPIDVEKELNTLEEQSVEANFGEALDLSSLMDEFKQLNETEENEPKQVPAAEQHQSLPQKTVATPSVKEKSEEEHEAIKKDKRLEKKLSPAKIPPAKTNNWRLLFTVVFSVVTLLATSGAWLYVNIHDRINKEEILAAQGISDIAMALTYAQIHHLTPPTKNWSDPKFLKNNFAAIIPKNASFLAEIDAHNHFTNCPYILRIYTNKNSSRFLVMALPVPSVLQWLSPKNAIVVDSQAMELRKIQDLRLLNRLLINPNTLENQNGMEVSALVKLGRLIPLQHLAEKTGHADFFPPKELATLHPGAENYIYNAPRYYQFAESFAIRAINLTKASEKASDELKQLQEGMLEITKLPNLVIYSSEGIESASQAKKAIKTFVPEAKFLNAYLTSSKELEIVGSHLLLESEISMREEEKIRPHSIHPEIKPVAYIDQLSAKPLNENHPLRFHLLALANSRKEALDPLLSDMVALLKKHTEEYDKDFSTKFSSLLKQYETLDKKESQKIAEEIHNLYDTYANMPLSEVLPYTRAAGLDQIAQVNLKMKESSHLSGEQFDYLLISIQNATGFTELAEAVANAASFIRIKHIPEATLLIEYQKRVRIEVTKKLDELLLSPSTPISFEELTPEKRKLLIKILEQSWITDLDEQQFYLNEFDSLKGSN